ncbi:MAG: TRAP transporter large permease [Beijerinckiaceae bacterium]
MDPIVVASLGMLGMFLLIGLQIPIGISMAISGIVGFGLLSGWKAAFSLVAAKGVGTLASEELAVIPLFLVMGSFANVSGLASDLYRLAYAFIGHRPGGLALATIGGCAGFGAICGSSIATAATMGRVSLPEMLKRNYEPSLATGSIAAGGTLGMLIPPSVIMVIYAFLTEQFVISMFIAAIIPGILAVLFHMITIMIVVRRNPNAGPAGDRTDWAGRIHAIRDSGGVLVMMLIVIGGIYGGVFSVNEAAALGAAVAFGFAVWRRKLNMHTLLMVMRETAGNTAMIYLIIIGAGIFASFISITKMPAEVVEMIGKTGMPPVAIIFALFAMFLVLGSIFDTIAAMVITLPFIYPMVIDLGYSPIWWGIILVMAIEVGMITPPIGMNVFVLHGVAGNIPLNTIFRGIFPFFYADVIRISLVIIFPALALWLPQLLGYKV